MADSTSDSGSVQSLQTEQVVEKKTESTTRFYALYSFYPQRIQSSDGTLPTEAQDNEDGSLSLNIVATNLTASAETDLRKILAQKLFKNIMQTKEGNFFSIRFSSMSSETLVPASCYYCQIETASDSLDFDQVLTDDKEGSSSNDSQQFVVCFISFLDSTLYLFRPELEQYSQSLIPLLDKELSQLSTAIHSYLQQWPYNVLEYLTRTLQYTGSSVSHLIYSALLNASLHISGATSLQEEDVKRFYKCCNLSPLLEQLQSDIVSVTGSSDVSDLWQLQPVVVSVTFLPEQGVTFDKNYVCKFCESAADALTAMEATNVTKIRELLETVKMRFVRNLNTLKRFLKQAEIDHYALYRALSYLRKCGCGDLLLRYVKLDAGPDTLNVLTVLETFIRDVKLPLM
uniref:Protein Njmu-R1 n=1 Tax=Arion vulgaris TaxID=1028688 RepID=A0A0B6ZYM9_9EUPU